MARRWVSSEQLMFFSSASYYEKISCISVEIEKKTYFCRTRQNARCYGGIS